jgi:hypothetical protein
MMYSFCLFTALKGELCMIVCKLSIIQVPQEDLTIYSTVRTSAFTFSKTRLLDESTACSIPRHPSDL